MCVVWEGRSSSPVTRFSDEPAAPSRSCLARPAKQQRGDWEGTTPQRRDASRSPVPTSSARESHASSVASAPRGRSPSPSDLVVSTILWYLQGLRRMQLSCYEQCSREASQIGDASTLRTNRALKRALEQLRELNKRALLLLHPHVGREQQLVSAQWPCATLFLQLPPQPSVA